MAITNILYLKFNNYFNRIVRKKTAFNTYDTGSLRVGRETVINFNPSNGVVAQHIAGKGASPFVDWDIQGPDYAIVYETDDNGNNPTIKSRWFIIDSQRIRKGQYNLTLKRDTVVDFMPQLINSKIYVEKGVIKNSNSPLLCNSESLSLNQIKKREILLKDRSNCPWLVMYIKKGVIGSNNSVTVPNLVDPYYYEELSTPIENWQYYAYVANDFNYASSFEYSIEFKRPFEPGPIIGHRFVYSTAGFNYMDQVTTISNLVYNRNYGSPTEAYDPFYYLSAAFDTYANSMTAEAWNIFSTYKNKSDFDNLMKYNGKIIKDSQGKFYEVTIVGPTNQNVVTNIVKEVQPTMHGIFNNVFRNANNDNTSDGTGSYQVTIKNQKYRVELRERTDLQTTLNFQTASKTTDDSSVYDVICMPYGDIKETFNGVTINNTSAERSFQVMNAIALKLTSLYVLDFQLLPYCPIQNCIKSSRTIEVPGTTSAIVAKDSGDNVCDMVFIAESANITFDIEQLVTELPNDVVMGSSLHRKILNDCYRFRLCSPNYNGLFEFNLAKNNVAVNYFNIDLTMKPITPYIHVNPNFRFLYGNDFNDIRGLVCGGDFSLAMMNDEWNVYEIQNKNYQNIFDRQIQNLDVNNAIAKQEAVFELAAGTAAGTASGAASGAMVGGGWGAAAGAVVGFGSSFAGGFIDYQNLNKRIKEQRDYAIDNFNMSIGNVKALPYSVTRTSAITANNKLFPFVEVYCCSDEELKAYINKLTYDGMTVGIIDTIDNYMSVNSESNVINGQNFFKGKLIRFDTTFGIENNIVEDINNELMKGVFI